MIGFKMCCVFYVVLVLGLSGNVATRGKVVNF